MKSIFTSLILFFLVHTAFGQFLSEKDISITSSSNIKIYTQKVNKQLLEGEHTVEMKNGSKYSASFNQGKIDGEYHQYDKNGVIIFTQNYSKGILDGKQTTFFPNGNVMEDFTFKKGKIDGVMRIYNAEGKMIDTRTFKKGKEIKKPLPPRPVPPPRRK